MDYSLKQFKSTQTPLDILSSLGYEQEDLFCLPVQEQDNLLPSYELFSFIFRENNSFLFEG